MLFASLNFQRLQDAISPFFGIKPQRELAPTPTQTPNQPATPQRSLDPIPSVDTNNQAFQDIVTKSQAFIDKYRMKNDLPALVSGTDVATASQKYGVDPKLILAQGLNETHFGTNPKATRALKYNSAFGMGSFDDGSQKMSFSSGTDATMKYAALVKKDYLGDTKTVDDLLKNYVNLKGSRYASDPNYEQKLKATFEKIKTFGL